MRVMYISRRFKENICATMHYQAIVDLFQQENVVTVDISLSGLCKNQCISFTKEKKINRLKQVLLLYPRWTSKRTINEICEIIKREHVDLVFVDEGFLGQLARSIKKTFQDQVKVVTFSHDIAKVMYYERLQDEGVRFLPEYLSLCRGEKINVRYSDCVLVLNERDNNLLNKIYKRNADDYLRMGVDEPDLREYETKEFSFEKKSPNDVFLLSVGTYYPPNLKGLRWFIDNVFIHMSDNFRLVIIGRGMEKFCDEYGNTPNVEIIGAVESLAAYYNNSDIVIAPVFGGGGMKQKTAEAFAYGKPLVCTIESIQGYETEIELKHNDKKIVFASDDIEDTKKALHYLEKNKLLGFMLEENEAYKQKYSKEALKSVLKKHLVKHNNLVQ